MIIRLSRGSFPPDRFDDIDARLRASAGTLVPAIKKLDGLVSYHSGIDRASRTMINVSVWESLEAALQMATLPEMQALAGEFVAAGVTFERPIVNYAATWTIP